MKITLTFLLTLALIGSADGSSSNLVATSQSCTELLSSEPSSVLMRCSIDDIPQQTVKTDSGDFSAFTYEGEGTLCKQGMPLLPAISRFVVVDPRSNLELVISEEGSPRHLGADNPPLRVDLPELRSSAPDLDTAGLYPPKIAEMSAPFIIRGVRMVQVTIYPVQYDFSTGEFIQHPRVLTEVRSVEGEAVNAVENPNRRGRSREFLKMMSEFAANGDVVGRDDPDLTTDPLYTGHYLVVVPANILQYIVPFIEWRRKAGYKMDIYSVPANDQANDNAVKTGISNRYQAYIDAGQDPFEYLLLVGDRSDYYEMHGAGSVLEAPQGANTGLAKHADYVYACLEGNDERPDIAFGRWIGGDATVLGLIMGRTLRYEADPDMDNPDWFTRGGAVSQHWGNSPNVAYHATIPCDARWGEQVLKSRGFTDVRFQESFDYDQYAANVGPWIASLMNDGSNVVVARSENYYWAYRNPNRHYFDNDVHANTVFPIRFDCSGHGEWSADVETRTGDANHLKGWVSCTYSWNGPITGISNAIWLDEVRGVMLLDLPMGWGYSYAINHFEQYLPSFQAAQIQVGRTDNNHNGDPGLIVWKGVPQVVAMEAPASISPQTKLLDVFVHVPDSDTPISGARVTFYAQGRPPAANDTGYVRYSRFWMHNIKTDANGIAQLVLSPTDTLVANSDLFFTVTGDSMKPCFAQARIEGQESDIAVGDYQLQIITGDEDDNLNPGERAELTLPASNVGQSVAAGVTATVTSLSPYLEIEGDNFLQFGDIEAGASAGSDHPITFALSPSCPDGAARPESKPSMLVEFTSGEQTWRSAISLNVFAPRLVFSSVNGGNVIPDSAASISVAISNLGRINSGPVEVELQSLGQGVTVINGNSTFPAVSPADIVQQNGGQFAISGNKVVIPGALTDLLLIFRTENGFIDTSRLTLQTMAPRDGAPIGPDKYGYVCFDDTDTLWDSAPHYRWIEINRAVQDYDYEGTRLNALEGQTTLDLGKCVALPLGFTTQFYGVEYDTITVTTNGFVSMGNQPRITNFNNYPLDQCIGGGVGMIAPFWDDLRVGNNSMILAYHDEDSSRFIVEWHRMALSSGGNTELTFEVIIHDKDFEPWITRTGDSNILFEYKTVSMQQNIRGSDAEGTNNNPYASVGISSPRGNSGLSYSWYNTYPTGAAPLENRRAILFSTENRFRSGILYGQVTDYATGQGIENAVVYTKHGFVAKTDGDGYWRIPEAIAETPFEITARKSSYDDSSYTDMIVHEQDSLEVNFGLLHPEFTPSGYAFGARLDHGLQTQIGFDLTNTGNGRLTWTAEKRLLGDANAPPWDLRRSYAATDSTHDNRIEGVVFGNNQFYLSGTNGNDPNMMYVLDRNGSLVNSYEQCGHSNLGFKDLEWDGSLIWASGERAVYGFTPDDGQVVYSFDGPNATNTAIAWDSDHSLLWIAGTTTNILAYDVNGNAADRTLNRKGRYIYGLAYWPEDPDGYKLYILDEQGGVNPTIVYKMNTETGDTIRVRTIPHDAGSTGMNGTSITNQFDVYSWVLMTIGNIAPANGGDQIKIYQLDARKDWMNLDTWSGTLESGERQDLTLTLNTAGLPDTLFRGEMLFHHNADSGKAHIDISLRVIGPVPPDPFDLLEPANMDTLTAFPQHGDTINLPEVRFSWRPTIDPNINDSVLTYVQWFSAGNVAVSYPVSDTFKAVNLDTLRLPIGFDQPLVWWVDAVSGNDSTESTERFTLNVIPNGLDEAKPIPIEFGLRSIYPSPFNGRAVVKFGADRAERTTLIAYDLLGREAAMLFDAVPRVGYYTVSWDADRLASGVYILRLQSAGRVKIAKVALVK